MLTATPARGPKGLSDERAKTKSEVERAVIRHQALGASLSMDSPTSSAITREKFGWEPTHPGLIEDLELGHYFTQQ